MPGAESVGPGAERLHNGDVPIDCYGRARTDTGGYCEGLHEENEDADGLAEYPVAQHGVGEGEGHTEERHDEISHGQVDQERCSKITCYF